MRFSFIKLHKSYELDSNRTYTGEEKEREREKNNIEITKELIQKKSTEKEEEENEMRQLG